MQEAQQENNTILRVAFTTATGQELVIGYDDLPTRADWSALREQIEGYINFTNLDMKLLARQEQNNGEDKTPDPVA